jgi:hypothetical protein
MAEEAKGLRGRLTVVGGGRKDGRSPRGRGRAAGVGGPPLKGRLAAVTDRCWRCRTKVRAVVGVLVDPAHTPDGSGFVAFDLVAHELATALDERALAARGVGPLRHRDSPGVAGGYIANGCLECDALIGRFELEDLLHDHLQAGGTHGQLDVGLAIELPVSVRMRIGATG